MAYAYTETSSRSSVFSLKLDSDRLISQLAKIQTDPSLGTLARNYLSHLVLKCGTAGLTDSCRDALAAELGRSSWTLKRLENRLICAGYLDVVEVQGQVCRTPWPDRFHEVSALVDTEQECPQSTATLDDPAVHQEQICPVSIGPLVDAEQNCPQSTIQCPGGLTASEASKPEPRPSWPVKTAAPLFNDINGNSTDKPINKNQRNPYRKSVKEVQLIAGDICEIIGHKSFKWACRILWNLPTEAEQTLYNTLSWVKSEMATGNVLNPGGLWTTKLREAGLPI